MIAIEAFRDARRRLLEQPVEIGPDPAWRLTLTELTDQFVREIADQACGEGGHEALAILAVGGYGRSELTPYTDIDLLVVPRADDDPTLDEFLRKLHRELHDAFGRAEGPKLSYAYFLQNDANALDFKTRTALLDTRLVYGSANASERFVQTARETLPTGEFLLSKIEERAAASRQWNDTPLAVEPHLKEGAGGLRSFQAANWIRQGIGQPARVPPPAYESLLHLRNALHIVSERPNDFWSRARQADVADRLGIPLPELTAAAMRALEALFGIWEETKADVLRGRIDLTAHLGAEDGRTMARAGATLSGLASGIATATALGLEVRSPMAATDEIDGPEALYAVASGEPTLRNLDRAGLLARLLPELERCRTLLPDDAVHAYSVFEHSLRTVRNLDELAKDRFYGELKSGLSDDDPLYLAALLHDTGKAVPGRPHSETGAEIASEVAARWRLSPGVADTVRWLVGEHLTMARFIGMRDVSEPGAVREFAGLVGDRERLDMLTLLTCADVSAVAPGTWSPAQDAFLKELHSRTAAMLESVDSSAVDADTMRKRVVRSLKDHAIDPDDLQAFLSRLPAQYAVNTAPSLVPVHMEMVAKARAGEPNAIWDHDRDRSLSEITVCAIDRPGLLSQILGVLYAHDLSVYGLRANTTTESLGAKVALDTVLAAFGNQMVPPSTGALVVRSIEEVLQGSLPLADLLTARGKDPNRRQENFKLAFLEGSPGILEFQAPRGRGMAFRLSRMIWEQGWDIVAARFGQWAGRGAAAFYITGPEGRPLQRDEVEAALIGKV